MTPIGGVEPEERDKECQAVCEPDELLGQPWTYELAIKGCVNLPVVCEMCYLEYDFDGDTFTTESVTQHTNSPTFDYVQILHRDAVTAEFIEYLQTEFLRINVFAQPAVTCVPKDRISSDNE